MSTDTPLPMPAMSSGQRGALIRMKAFAAALLLLAALGYASCRILSSGAGVWGYLQAMCEAAMVGGFADWFAVTALFRHPLGIPIPHTAIIPRKKDQIGQSLASFVEQNFLTADVVGPRLEAIQLPYRLGVWLSEPTHAARVADEACAGFAALAGGLRDAAFEVEIEVTIAGFADARLRAADVAPALARIIDAVRDEGQHQEVLTVLLRALMHFLEQNQYVLRARLAQESPEWVPEWVDDRIFARLFNGLRSFLSDLSSDQSHELRQQFDRFLGDYTHALRNDPQRAAAVNNTKLQLLEHPEVRVWLTSLWSRLKASLLRDAQDPDSQLRASLLALTQRVASALRDDATLQRRLDQLLQRAISYVLEHYSTDIAALISGTVSRWDAEETGRRLELQVGRDLQFIRINGTVVGALVGLVIYTAGQLL